MLAQVPTVDTGAALLGVGLLITVITLGIKAVDFIKLLTNKDVNGFVTMLVVWAVVMLLTFVAAESDFASSVKIGADLTLDKLNSGSKVLLGLLLGSAAMFAVDRTKARDSSDSASQPDLLPGKNSG